MLDGTGMLHAAFAVAALEQLFKISAVCALERDLAEFAKNYLKAEELDILNRIVNLYLDFAELQAKSHTPMYMKDWIQKLDEFLKLSGKELLTHAGTISAEVAKLKANTEYDKFKERTLESLSPVELHFIENFDKEQKRLNKK